MLRKGEIGSLQKGRQDYWSLERRQDHALKCVEGGGSKVGKMAGQSSQDHALKCVEGGGSKVGKMAGQALEDHALKCVEGGGSKVGKMSGQALEDAGALVSQAAKVRHELLLKIANGVARDTEKWRCESSPNGNAILHRFCTDKTSREPIRGVRKFEEFVLNDANGFGEGSLTPEGANALQTLKDRKKSRGKRV